MTRLGDSEVVAADLHRMLVQRPGRLRRIGAAQREHRRGLADRHVVEDAQRADQDAGDHESLEREPATVVHGDMKADHLLAGPDGVVVLDGDRCALADPALDVGKFLADLRWWSVAGSGFGVADAEAEVLAGYASPGPRLDRARLYSALMLVKMAGRRVSVARRDWAARTTTLLALAGQALDGGTDR